MAHVECLRIEVVCTSFDGSDLSDDYVNSWGRKFKAVLCLRPGCLESYRVFKGPIGVSVYHYHLFILLHVAFSHAAALFDLLKHDYLSRSLMVASLNSIPPNKSSVFRCSVRGQKRFWFGSDDCSIFSSRKLFSNDKLDVEGVSGAWKLVEIFTG